MLRKFFSASCGACKKNSRERAQPSLVGSFLSLVDVRIEFCALAPTRYTRKFSLFGLSREHHEYSRIHRRNDSMDTDPSSFVRVKQLRVPGCTTTSGEEGRMTWYLLDHGAHMRKRPMCAHGYCCVRGTNVRRFRFGRVPPP